LGKKGHFLLFFNKVSHFDTAKVYTQALFYASIRLLEIYTLVAI
jgi:hypothetical protein